MESEIEVSFMGGVTPSFEASEKGTIKFSEIVFNSAYIGCFRLAVSSPLYK